MPVDRVDAVVQRVLVVVDQQSLALLRILDAQRLLEQSQAVLRHVVRALQVARLAIDAVRIRADEALGGEVVEQAGVDRPDLGQECDAVGKGAEIGVIAMAFVGQARAAVVLDRPAAVPAVAVAAVGEDAESPLRALTADAQEAKHRLPFGVDFLDRDDARRRAGGERRERHVRALERASVVRGTAEHVVVEDVQGGDDADVLGQVHHRRDAKAHVGAEDRALAARLADGARELVARGIIVVRPLRQRRQDRTGRHDLPGEALARRGEAERTVADDVRAKAEVAVVLEEGVLRLRRGRRHVPSGLGLTGIGGRVDLIQQRRSVLLRNLGIRLGRCGRRFIRLDGRGAFLVVILGLIPTRSSRQRQTERQRARNDPSQPGIRPDN